MVKKCERAIDTRHPGVTPLNFRAHAWLFFSHVVTRSVTLSLFFSILAWFNNGLKLYCSLFCGLGARFRCFFSFLLLFSYGVFCFFDLKDLKENSKNLKRTQNKLKALTLYLFKSIQSHFKSTSNELQVQFKSISIILNYLLLFNKA